MALHSFHCTDGVSFFADQQGLSVTREDEMFPAAQFQREFPNYRDMMRELRGTGLARTEGNDQPLTIEVPSATWGTGRLNCIVVS
jgi:hypothetical protein